MIPSQFEIVAEARKVINAISNEIEACKSNSRLVRRDIIKIAREIIIATSETVVDTDILWGLILTYKLNVNTHGPIAQ